MVAPERVRPWQAFEEVCVKLVISVLAIAIAACAVEPTTEQETSGMAPSIDESHDGGVADCGTKDTPLCPMAPVPAPQGEPRQCGTLDTPPCPAPTARQAEWQTCGTKDTPPCPMAPVSAPQGGPSQCGTPETPPCPAPARSPQHGGLPQCGTLSKPLCPIAAR